MVKNYLLIFFRNIVRNKAFTILNAGGFALGMAACLLIVLFIANEKSFDSFHQKAGRIYRLTEWQRFPAMQEQHVAVSMMEMGQTLMQDHSEVESFVRIESKDDAITRNSQNELFKHHLVFTDSTFFHVFDFPFISGNPKTVLNSPDNIVVTRSTALELFGSTDVIGKTMDVKRRQEFKTFTIAAVLEDVPANSHIQFEVLLPFRALVIMPWMEGWDSNWLNTYVLLNENADISTLQAAMPAYEKKYLKDEDKYYDLAFQPLLDIHLGSDKMTHDELNYKKFSGSYVRTFAILAIAVLLIAIFNFINLSTAIAIKRMKEVGIRKTVGAGKWQLVRQFTTEAVLFALLSFALAVIITFFTLPLINELFDRSIVFDPGKDITQWLVVFLAVVLVGIISGIYPALMITRFQPVTMVKGAKFGKQRFSLRHILVVSQFVIAVGMIIATIVITQQLRFAYKKETGFDKEQIVLVPMNATANKNSEVIRNELLASQLITDMTAYNERLGSNLNQWGATYIDRNGEKKGVSASHIYVDHNFISFFNIQVAKGRTFSKERGDTAGSVYLINEAFAREMNIKDPVGIQYKGNWTETMGKVIGVVKDFNFNSLHHKVAPLYISVLPWEFSEMAIKLKPESTKEALAHIEKTWKKHVPDLPYEYSFLDEHMNSLYTSDQQAGRIVNIATILAIVIACLGLFGMALYTIETRVKEIGIRKVLGASVSNIAVTVSIGFLKLVAVSSVIAFPLAWIMMNKWLEDFAFRIKIEWWVFLIAGVLSIVIAIATVSFQALRAALSNPVKSLRSE